MPALLLHRCAEHRPGRGWNHHYAAVIWDGVSDPLMGWIVTRTRSRFGKFRPYILFGAPLMAFSFVGMFAAPIWFPDHMIVACLVTHTIFEQPYTVASVPYSSLAAALTHDSQERGTMAGVRMIAAMVGGIVTAATMLELARFFGNGDMREGFVQVASVYALLSSVMMVVIFLTTSNEVSLASRQRITSRQTLSFLRHNRAFWILCGASFVGVIGSAIGGKSIVYYINYYAGHPDSVSEVMSIGILGAGIGIPLWTLVARHFLKKVGLDYWREWCCAGQSRAFLLGCKSRKHVICARLLQWNHGRRGGCHVLVHAAGYCGVRSMAQ